MDSTTVKRILYNPQKFKLENIKCYYAHNDTLVYRD